MCYLVPVFLALGAGTIHVLPCSCVPCVSCWYMCYPVAMFLVLGAGVLRDSGTVAIISAEVLKGLYDDV